MSSIKVLHITPHLGGGVGTVVLGWIKKEGELSTDYLHEILCLEENKNPVVKEFKERGLSICEGVYNKRNLLKRCIARTDLVLIHWWNHPRLFDLLTNFDFPPCRLILWNHVSSLYPPYNISEKLVNFSDCFVFTSPVSFHAEEVKCLPEYLRERLDVVWSAFGSEDFDVPGKVGHSGFVVGFTGTVDYGKLHPRFLVMCSRIEIPGVQFIVCSGDSQERVRNEAICLGVADKFSFKGRVPDIRPYLSMFDVFGYPLQPRHFGTCEQALGEAMAAGVVPVVLDNPAERYIVEDGVTGIIAKTEEEYCRAIEYLYHNPARREVMSRNASKSAREKYSMTKKIEAWRRIFGRVVRQNKRERRWDTKKGRTGAEVFIESLGRHGEVFAEYILAKKTGNRSKLMGLEQRIMELFETNCQWHSETKGGVKHYLKVFPHDPYLQEWKAILERGLGAN